MLFRSETALWQLKDWAGDHNRDTMKITDKYKEIKQLVSLEELINLGWEESNKQETTTTKDDDRSEERRVGKECRCRGSPYH